MYYVASGSIPPQRPRSTARPMAASTPRSSSGWRGSTVAARCSTTARHRPRRTGSIRAPGSPLEAADDGLHRHRLTKTGALPPNGDAISGRVPLYFNNDVVFGVVRPAEAHARRNLLPERDCRRNALRPRGERRLRHDIRFASLRPRRLPGAPDRDDLAPQPDPGSEQRMLYLEAPSVIEPPKRYRNDYGQLLEHAPYSQRDPTPLLFAEPRADEGEFVIQVRSSDRITAYHYPYHLFDAAAGMATSGRSGSTSATSSRSWDGSTSRRRSTRRSRPNFVAAWSCRASSTITCWRSRRRTTIRTSTAMRSSITSPGTS